MPVASYNQMPSFSAFITEETPKLDVHNMEGGLRVLLYPGAVSLSMSYLTILDRYPSDAIETMAMPMPPFSIVPSVLGHSRQRC